MIKIVAVPDDLYGKAAEVAAKKQPIRSILILADPQAVRFTRQAALRPALQSLRRFEIRAQCASTPPWVFEN